jgi:hypothetical protein
MKPLLLVICLASLTTAILYSKENYIIPKAKDYPGVFQIDPTNKGLKGQCTATLISERHALTAASCFPNWVWDKNSFDVTFSDGKVHKVDNVYLTGCGV